MAKAAKIPVIDISGDADETRVAKELVEAAIEHGFVYIRSTGRDMPVDAIEDAFDISKRLFNAPLSEKQTSSRELTAQWSAMHYETLDPANQRVGDFKEAFNFGEFVDGKAQQPIPPTIAADEPRISAFRDLCYNLSLKLNTLLGLGLEVDPPDFFTSAHLRSRGPSGTTLRFLYYPPASAAATKDSSDIRAGAHSDYGSLTLLFRLRGQPGLEILSPGSDGETNTTWSAVPVVPPGTEHDPAPPILVNIGDLLSYWTNGLLRSTVHRVVFPPTTTTTGTGAVGAVEGENETDGPRYSIAYFCHPWGGAELRPVPSERVRAYEGGGGELNPYAERTVLTAEHVTADEHLMMRLKASYLQLYQDKE